MFGGNKTMDTSFLQDKGYLKGSNESRLASLGINVNKNKTGNNVNPGEFANYINDYQTGIKENPAGTIAGYGNVDKAYETAKSTYLDMLPSLQPRYQALLDQIKGEQDVAQGKNAQLSGSEDIALKNEIAKRGLSTSTNDSFYAGQSNQLQEGQNLRDKETDLAFSRERLMTEEQRGKEETAIRTAVAGLTTEQANALQGIITTEKSLIANVVDAAANDRQYATSLNYQIDRDKIIDNQWEKTFAFTKSEAAADRALEEAKFAFTKSKSGSSDNDYYKDILSVTENAYSSANKFPGMRESIEKYMTEKYPNKKDTIKEDISAYFPNGWEDANKSKNPVTPIKEIGDWVYYSDGTRENSITGEVQAQQ